MNNSERLKSWETSRSQQGWGLNDCPKHSRTRYPQIGGVALSGPEGIAELTTATTWWNGYWWSFPTTTDRFESCIEWRRGKLIFLHDRTIQNWFKKPRKSWNGEFHCTFHTLRTLSHQIAEIFGYSKLLAKHWKPVYGVERSLKPSMTWAGSFGTHIWVHRKITFKNLYFHWNTPIIISMEVKIVDDPARTHTHARTGTWMQSTIRTFIW